MGSGSWPLAPGYSETSAHPGGVFCWNRSAALARFAPRDLPTPAWRVRVRIRAEGRSSPTLPVESRAADEAANVWNHR